MKPAELQSELIRYTSGTRYCETLTGRNKQDERNSTLRVGSRKYVAKAPNRDNTPTIPVEQSGDSEGKHDKTTHNLIHCSCASQSNPTGIVDFVLRDDVDGEAVLSDGPTGESLGVVAAIRSAIHGGVGEFGDSDIPAESGTGCGGI